MTPSRLPRALSSLVVLAAFLLSGQSARLSANPVNPGKEIDPVTALRQYLESTSNPPQFVEQEKRQEWEAKREKRIRELAERIKTPAELLRGLAALKRFGGQAPLQGEPSPTQKVWGEMLDRLLTVFRSILEGEDAIARAAALTQVAELLAEDDQPYRSLIPRLTPLLPTLVEQVKHRDSRVRKIAARTLGQCPLQAATVKALGEMLEREPEGSVVEVAASALGEKLVQVLSPHMVQPQLPGQVATDPREHCGPIILSLGKGASHASPEGRKSCLQQITKIVKALEGWRGQFDSTLEEALRPGVPQQWRDERIAYLKPFLRALPDLQQQTPAILRGLEDKNTETAVAALEALEALGDLRKGTRSLESKLPEEPGKEKRKPFGQDLKEAIPLLQRNLGHKELRIRVHALYVLEALDEDAEPVAPNLIAALGDENLFIRWGAARVLANLAPRAGKEAVPALVKLLQDPDADVRATVILALNRYGPLAAPAVGKLTELVKKGDPEMRLDAIRALQSIGAEARSAGSVLIEVLAAPETELRLQATRALGQLGPDEKPTREALAKALLDPNSEVRRAASVALLPAAVEKPKPMPNPEKD